jgi:WD40 repeat protein
LSGKTRRGKKEESKNHLAARRLIMTMQPTSYPSGVDPLFTLNSSRGSDVTGVCFVRDPITSHLTASRDDIDQNGLDTSSCSEDDEISDDDYPPLHFRCADVLLGPQRNKQESSYRQAAHLSAASRGSLSGAVLASCHVDGCCKLWDLATRRCYVEELGPNNGPRGGPGLAIRRLSTGGGDAANQFLYQTRDHLGTVSLHDLNRPCTPLLQMHTYSTTFCAMSPCHTGNLSRISGARNLVALPTEEHSMAIVRDLRCDPRGSPAWRVALGDEYISSMYGSRRKYGMLTSLALCIQETTENIVLGCGMENGSALFYDLGAVGHGRDQWRTEPGGGEGTDTSNMNDSGGNTFDLNESDFTCSTLLGKDPVLCMDIVSSYSQASHIITERDHNTKRVKSSASVVAVAGCAGDADDLSSLPHQQGTVSTIKVKLLDNSSQDVSNNSCMKATVRSKTRTCSMESGGKIGVSICRFRPDGRVFAVGGWDHRIRLFGRTTSKPLAILRGHQTSVTAIDWAGDSALTGLLASSAGDRRICIWRVFPHSLRE